jgi:hypothetical protein
MSMDKVQSGYAKAMCCGGLARTSMKLAKAGMKK